MSAPHVYRFGRAPPQLRFTAAAVVLAAGSCTSLRHSYRAEYCAIMPDSVGLYAGNPVTQMGYRSAKSSPSAPAITSVRVEFTVTTDRPVAP